MKFARAYQEALQREEYPKEWVESAISYKKLKKCIKRVQQELQNLGLDHETLQRLWQQGSVPALVDQNGNHEQIMHYDFTGDGAKEFVPKLTIALDPKDGSPMDAWLSDDTRRFLKRYSRRQSSATIAGTPSGHVFELQDSADSSAQDSSEQSETASADDMEAIEEPETIEIPLTSDSEFFQILRRELSNLERLQKEEQRQLESEILALGNNLRSLQLNSNKSSNKKKTKEELEVWREIFRLYNEAEVFFSSHEIDAGARDANHAQTQLTQFTKTLNSSNSNLLSRLPPSAKPTLHQFLRINLTLLQFLKYQEINLTALTKIMKKFDKQTALHAKEGVLSHLTNTHSSIITQDLAKATCFTISNELIKIIPQLDDYLCPICFSISWRPVRLRCGHIFCLRCLSVMQRAGKDECALCREPVIMEATEANLDETLAIFLKKNFQQEVKEKQRENEIAAGVEQFGEGYTGTHRCVVM